MTSARDIARELLPYVVMIWATLALLGGALESTQTAAGNESHHAAIESGIGLCAITVACIVRGAAKHVRSLPRLVFTLFKPAHLRLVTRGTSASPSAYHRPPPLPPSLERLQILRT